MNTSIIIKRMWLSPFPSGPTQVLCGRVDHHSPAASSLPPASVFYLRSLFNNEIRICKNSTPNYFDLHQRKPLAAMAWVVFYFFTFCQPLKQECSVQAVFIHTRGPRSEQQCGSSAELNESDHDTFIRWWHKQLVYLLDMCHDSASTLKGHCCVMSMKTEDGSVSATEITEAKGLEFSSQRTSSFFFLNSIPRYLLQEATEAVNWRTPWAGEEFQRSSTQILNSHQRPNPDDEIWTLTAPCCWKQPYTDLFEHTLPESGWHSWRGAHTAHGIMCEEEKTLGALQLEGFKGEVRI